jgi:zinc protease
MPRLKRNWLAGLSLAMVLLMSAFEAPSMIAATEPAGAETSPSAEASAGAGAAQEAWRKKPPELPPPRPFRLPPVATYKLENGLTVQLVEDHRVPFVTVFLGVKAGSAMDPPDLRGLASMTADMLTEGTSTRTSRRIAEEVDFIGGAISGAADYDYSVVSGSALSKYTDKLLDLVSDVVLNPSFPDSELKLKKTNLIQELIVKRSQPGFLKEERFHQVVFGNHPYGVVAPTPESVERMNVEALKDFHARHFLPNEAVLIVVGDFQTPAMKDLISRSFGAWKSGALPVGKLPEVPGLTGRRIYVVDRAGSVQASMKLGNLAIKKKDPDYFPMLVANQVLGGAAHARLFLNIREQKGYTYGAYSGFAARKEPGAFAAEAEVRTDVVAPALQEFLYELDRIRNVKVSDKELQDAKNYLTGSFQLGLETQAGLANRLLEVQLYDLPADYLERYTERVLAVTTDDVRRVARKDIDLDNLTIVVVGDAAKIKPDLQYFAPVQVFDTSGKPVGSATAGSAAALE